MNNITMEYRGYTALIRFSDEDECLVGQLVGINDIVGFHGDSEEEIRTAFHESVDDYLATCAKIGREPNKPDEHKLQESLAMLRMLEMSAADVEAGRVRDADEVFDEIRHMIAEKRKEQR